MMTSYLPLDYMELQIKTLKTVVTSHNSVLDILNYIIQDIFMCL